MNDISHFSVRADDVERAKSFYSEVFGWQFEAWGPPGFFLIRTSDDSSAIHGDIHQREIPLTEGGFCGFECTITVADINSVATSIVENGGTIVYQKAVIHGVGEIIRFTDPEGNFLCAMRYDSSV